MPGGDGTGPAGFGPMTGRAAGYCAGYPVPGYMNPYVGGGFVRGFGRGLAWGGGRGKGWRWNVAYGLPYQSQYFASPYYPPPSSPDDEKKFLKSQADFLQNELDSIKKRLDEVEQSTKKVD